MDHNWWSNPRATGSTVSIQKWTWHHGWDGYFISCSSNPLWCFFPCGGLLWQWPSSKETFPSRAQITSQNNSFDLLALAHDLWATSPATPIPTEVNGHADELGRPLTHLEYMNSLADSHAKDYLALRPKRCVSRPLNVTHGMLQVRKDDYTFGCSLSSSLQQIPAVARSKEALFRRCHITTESWEQLDHGILTRTAKRWPLWQRIFSTKWISGQLPVATRLIQRGHSLVTTCPQCFSVPETVQHLRTCPSPKAIASYQASLSSLESYLNHCQTDPIITTYLLSILSLLRLATQESQLPYPCSLTKQPYYKVFLSQHKIGWNNFQCGLLSNQWAPLQQQYYTSIGSRRSGLTWASNLISQIWILNHNQWKHRNEAWGQHHSHLQDLQGVVELDQAIKYELDLGAESLPIHFHSLFTQLTVEDLLSLETGSNVRWFCTVRSAKEAMGISRSDIFTYSQAHRNWIGLKWGLILGYWKLVHILSTSSIDTLVPMLNQIWRHKTNLTRNNL